MTKLPLLAYLTVVLAVSGCHQNNSAKAGNTVINKMDTAAFIANFKPMQFDTLHISSDYNAFEDPKYFLTGVPIDSPYRDLFPDSSANLKRQFENDMYKIYAVGKFTLDNGYEGYLVRHPGEYFSSVI